MYIKSNLIFRYNMDPAFYLAIVVSLTFGAFIDSIIEITDLLKLNRSVFSII